MSEANVHQVEFWPMAQGMDPTAPPRSQMPGSGLPMWRSLLNLRVEDGLLRGREGTQEQFSNSPPFSVLSGGGVLDQSPNLIMEIPSAFGNNPRYLVAAREIFVRNEFGTWFNITPVHSAGTVSVSGTSVTGSSTGWLDNNIIGSNFSLFEVPSGSGTWHQVQSVASNTSLTLATSAGTHSAGSTYRIRRPAAGTAPTFGRVLNGDVYLVGQYGAGSIGTSRIPAGAALRIPGLADIVAPGPWTPQYLVSGLVLAPGVESTGLVMEFLGFEILEDGRLMVAGHWFDGSGSTAGSNRVWYSSPLNPAVWTSSPGGFSDLSQKAAGISAMTRLGRSLAVHFEDQVTLGEPTGLLDPPMAWYRTRATVGAFGPKAVTRTPHGDMYVGRDRRIYAWNGDQEQVALEIAAPLTESIASGEQVSDNNLRGGHALYVPRRGEWSLFYGSEAGQREIRYNLGRRELTAHQYAFNIGSVAQAPGGGSSGINHAGTVRALVGTSSTLDGPSSRLVHRLTTFSAIDSVTGANLPTGGWHAETGELDLGVPNTLKVIERVEIFLDATGTITFSAYRGTSSSAYYSATVGPSNPVVFHPDLQAGETFRFRLSGESSPPRMVRMAIHFAPVADGRAP